MKDRIPLTPAAENNPPVSESSHTLTSSTDNSSLAHTLQPRHVSMIAIGGIIGAGLFVGSAKSINSAGPSIILSYTLAGIIVLMICQVLAELATTWSGKGSFSLYGTLAYGKTFGTVVGAMYWWFWVLMIPFEAIALGTLLDRYIPLADWQITFLCITLLTILNLFSSSIFAESEYILSMTKVISILAFIAVGFIAIFGLTPHPPHGISHLWSEGFFPHGISGTLVALLLAITSYAGAESITLSAKESADPVNTVKKLLRSLVCRVTIFYLGSLFVATSLVAYYAIDPRSGTFATVLSAIGVPYSQEIVDAIVFIALFSCLNSAIYISSRMLHSMGETQSAPKWVSKVSANKVPLRAVLISSFIGLLAVIGQYNMGEKFFNYLMESSGTIILLIYASMILAQLKLRAKAQRLHLELPVKMWFHPWLSIMTLCIIITAIGWLISMPEERIPVSFALMVVAIFTIITTIGTHRLKTHISPSTSASSNPTI